jgi:hypothetical protein
MGLLIFKKFQQIFSVVELKFYGFPKKKYATFELNIALKTQWHGKWQDY